MKINYNTIVYLIISAILVTLGIQVYLNVVYYKSNKAELINQTRFSLNQAVEDYYAESAKNNNSNFDGLDSIFVKSLSKKPEFIEASQLELLFADSIHQEVNVFYSDSFQNTEVMFLNSDSNKLNEVKDLALKIMVSIEKDTVDLEAIYTKVSQDFDSQNWDFPFALSFQITDTINSSKSKVFKTQVGTTNLSENVISVKSHSLYLPKHSELILTFSNTGKILFNKSIGGIALSLILSVIMMSALWYLLQIIKKQKQLAEIKNDLISNITHEFKTPITTISTALQGMEKFNETNDPEKNKMFINVSNIQLNKLNLMVEKLLETATLDSNQLAINRERISIQNMLEQLTAKHQLTASQQQIVLHIDKAIESISVDPFHFENALNNLIENAIKYGGNQIDIKVEQLNNIIEISVTDNGEGIKKEHQKLVFDKFYRVPHGNVHNVKGFGIGLYYSKVIIEKHGGKLSLSSTQTQTTFKIELDV